MLLVGWTASVLTPGRLSEGQRQMTWRNVVRRPVPEEPVSEPGL